MVLKFFQNSILFLFFLFPLINKANPFLTCLPSRNSVMTIIFIIIIVVQIYENVFLKYYEYYNSTRAHSIFKELLCYYTILHCQNIQEASLLTLQSK